MNINESTLTYTNLDTRYRLDVRNTSARRLCSEEANRYIAKFVDYKDNTAKIIYTSDVLDVETLNKRSVRSIVNLKPVNDIQGLNKFLAVVNRKLPYNGLYIGCVETLEQRKTRIVNKFSKVIAYPYYVFDFILKRVFPKWGPTKKIYNVLTHGKNRAISTTETLGRLRVCGFKIEDYNEEGNLTYFAARKTVVPVQTTEINYGVVIRLRRVGRGGKLFTVYKIRTMHPYAEFLQDYLHEKNGIENGGKFHNDFRITSWGRWLRKFWLDEQPMWINWLRGELKLVGVRPVSKQYLTLYPKDFRRRRIKYTPGLIPPFYVDLPETIEEIVASEKKYFDAYDKHPWLTDIRYFFMVLYNILIKQARSA